MILQSPRKEKQWHMNTQIIAKTSKKQEGRREGKKERKKKRKKKKKYYHIITHVQHNVYFYYCLMKYVNSYTKYLNTNSLQ